MHHIYQQLGLHLGRHPFGFPKTSAGQELEILKRLFTREEAEIALHLTPRSQTVDDLATKTGIAGEELARVLANMADKGAIFEDRRKGNPRYALIPFMPGFYEFQVQHLDEQLAHAFEEIFPSLAGEMAGARTPWMRVMPAEQSISQMEVIPYQKASEMVSKAEIVAITDCICRKEQKLVGRGCARPRDSICLYFGAYAQFIIDKGIGQRATAQDTFKVLERAENASLVHLGANVMENITAMCQCCPCCCAVLRTATELKMPTAIAKSNFLSAVNVEFCTGCESCVTTCPVQAISMKDEKAKISNADCIGCGLCVLECPSQALSLAAKKREDIVLPPRSWTEMLLSIAEETGRTYFYSRG